MIPRGHPFFINQTRNLYRSGYFTRAGMLLNILNYLNIYIILYGPIFLLNPINLKYVSS